MPSKIDGLAVGSVLAGTLFVYAGVTGKSIPGAIQAVIRGQAPGTAAAAATIEGASGGGGGGTGGLTGGSVPHTGGSWSHGQLVALWILAGGSRQTANNAACHAIQESSGNASVTSANPDGGTNVGLFQLDTPGGVGAGYTVEQLKNPLLNARITVRATKDGQDWSDWSSPGC